MAADAVKRRGRPVRPASAATALWLLVLWIVLSIIGCLLVALVLGPAPAAGRAVELRRPASRPTSPSSARSPPRS